MKNLPTLPLNLTEYAGAAEVTAAWHQSLKPDPFLLVSEWADTYRVLSPKSAAEPGKWRTDRTPYLREIMDQLSPASPIQNVVFKKGAQVGGTEAGNNWIGYVIHMAPGPFLAVWPTVDLAKRHSKQRLETQIEETPQLRERIKPARTRDSGNTILSKEFPGGVLVLTGANSAVGLRSMPARYLFLDEVDAYPGDVDGEGDPIFLAERRTATFKRRRKVFKVSTPTVKSLSRIDREYEASDQRLYHVPCPHCNHMQPLEFNQLRWPEGKPYEAEYACIECGCLIAEHHKTTMLAAGEWRATAVSKDGVTAGYHLSSLYSPVGWFGWGDAAATYERALEDGDLMKGFVNTILGEVYEEANEAPEWQRLYERREDYPQGIVPLGGLFLTAGVDVQKDRLECEIVAWGRNKESWSVDYRVIAGDTAKPEAWQELESLLQHDWPHAAGGTLPIRVLCIDSGYATQDVYGWVRGHPKAIWGASGVIAPSPRTVVAVKGQERDTALILSVSKGDTAGKRRGVRVWSVSGPVAKVELYRWLKLEWPTAEDLATGENYPPGTCHFPQYGEEYFKQLTAERQKVKIYRGFPKVYWEKDPRRNNEALDCRVYARAAAAIYGLDHFNEATWQAMETALGIKPAESTAEPQQESAKLLPQVRSIKPNDPYL